MTFSKSFSGSAASGEPRAVDPGHEDVTQSTRCMPLS